MTIDQTQQLPVPPARHDDHDHAWRRIDAGEAVRTWAYRCEICRRTWMTVVV